MMQNCLLTDRVCKRGKSWMVWGKRWSFQMQWGEVWGAEARGTWAQPTTEATFCRLLWPAFLPGFSTKPPGKPVSLPHGCWRFGSLTIAC